MKPRMVMCCLVLVDKLPWAVCCRQHSIVQDSGPPWSSTSLWATTMQVATLLSLIATVCNDDVCDGCCYGQRRRNSSAMDGGDFHWSLDLVMGSDYTKQ